MWCKFGGAALVLVAALILLVPASPAQVKNGGGDLPVTRIVLFSSGVGYFQRDGQINGQATIPLHFTTEQINDLLKSLIVQDRGNGQVSVVQYDNRNPVDRTLKTFALDLTGDPSLGQLLTQARGERIQITLPQENSGKPIEGVIVGLEKRKELLGKDQVIEVELLNLLTDKGIITRPLSRIEGIDFVKPALRDEFRKALEILAAGRDRQKKTVTLQFTGAGKRAVSVAYLVESPVWKTTYRLALDKGKLFLQGWAIVENTTDDDWTNVRVGLVEGRPISFRMDLYEPLFVPRPLITLERFAGLVPQIYAGEVYTPPRLPAAGVPPPVEGRNEFGIPDAKAGAGKKGGKAGGAAKAPPPPGSVDFSRSAGEAATAELGDFFQYEIKEPVSLARQKSALLPILNQPIEGKHVSIYNARVQAKYPMLGLLLTNSSKLHLMQGPITVYEENSYAGDALLPDLRPKEERLISYAVDLGVEVVPSNNPKGTDTENLVSIKITQGILHATYKQRQTVVYTLTNRTDQQREIIIEHPKQSGWDLVLGKDEKAPKETRDVYRFEVAVPPGKNNAAPLTVVLERLRAEQVVLTNSPDNTIRFYLQTTKQAGISQALKKAIDLKAAWAETQHAIQQERDELANLEKNQARLRENLKVLEKTSDLYKDTMKRFEAQENEFDRRQAKISELQPQADRQRREYEAFISKLNVE